MYLRGHLTCPKCAYTERFTLKTRTTFDLQCKDGHCLATSLERHTELKPNAQDEIYCFQCSNGGTFAEFSGLAPEEKKPGDPSSIFENLDPEQASALTIMAIQQAVFMHAKETFLEKGGMKGIEIRVDNEGRFTAEVDDGEEKTMYKLDTSKAGEINWEKVEDECP